MRFIFRLEYFSYKPKMYSSFQYCLLIISAFLKISNYTIHIIFIPEKNLISDLLKFTLKYNDNGLSFKKQQDSKFSLLKF